MRLLIQKQNKKQKKVLVSDKTCISDEARSVECEQLVISQVHRRPLSLIH